MKFRRSILFSLLACVMAVVMAATNPLGVLAEGENQAGKYVSDVRIGYGASGKQQLIDAGYTVWQDVTGKELNANETGAGDDVWIGYKTTDNADDAITDFATMNMDGRYSFEDYQAHINELKQNVSNILKGFREGVKEFAANYNARSEYAKTAMGILSKYKEDDTGKTIGQLVLEEAERLKTQGSGDVDTIWNQILLEANEENTTVITTALALGCTESAGNTFITRLQNAEYKAEGFDPAADEARRELYTVIPNFRTQLTNGEMVYEEIECIELTEEELAAAEATLGEDSTEEEQEKAIYLAQCSKYLQEMIDREVADIQLTSEELLAAQNAAGKNASEEKLAEAIYNAKYEKYRVNGGLVSVRDVFSQVELYYAAKRINYGNLELDGEQASLFDVIMLPTEQTQAGEVFLDAAKINMLAEALTPGQRGLISMAGLSMLVGNAIAVETPDGTDQNGITLKKLSEFQKWNEILADMPEISVYAGVDRTLFENTDDVAMTGAAIEASKKYRDITWGQDTSKSWKENTALQNAMKWSAVVTGAIAGGCFLLAGIAKLASIEVHWAVQMGSQGVFIFESFAEAQAQALGNLVTRSVSFASEGVKGACGTFAANIAILGVVAMVVACIFTVVYLVQLFYKPATSEPNYSRIPRALVEEVTDDATGEKSFHNYYAVKRIDAEANIAKYNQELKNKYGDNIPEDVDPINSLLLYGDLNSLNAEANCQWLVLYYTKDKALGEPLTPELLVTTGTEGLTTDQASAYSPIHMFQDVGAADLNGYCLTHRTNADAKPTIIRAYLKRSVKTSDSTTPTVRMNTGSLFSTGNIAVGLVCLIVGAGVSGGLTYLLTKKKKAVKQES